MSLLDGRYEVIAQRALGGGLTLFEATAPDGAPVRIEWYEVAPEREAEFETYRRLLRRLRQAGMAAVQDVIARPGAHYVAWEAPPPGSSPVAAPTPAELPLPATPAPAAPGWGAAGKGAARAPAEDEPADVVTLLSGAGYSLAACDFRRVQTRPPRLVLYGLAFGSSPQARPPGDGATVAGGHAAAAPVVRAGRTRPLRQRRAPLSRGAEALGSLPTRTLSWGLAGIVTLLAVLVGAVALRTSLVDTVVAVPSLVGTDAQAAAAALTRLGLGVDAAPIVSDAAPGTVLALEPAPGSYLRPGRSVLLRYAVQSGDLNPSDVPTVVGLTFPGTAEAALDRAGARLGAVARVHADAPAGTVLAQALEENGEAGSGGAVRLLVSMGPQGTRTFVPDLVSLDLPTALALAQVAGIGPERVFVDEVVSSTGAPGTVLEQSLAPYVPVSQGSAVLRLVVQTGTPAAPPVADGAPDVVGMSLAEAREAAAGWDLQVTAIGNRGLPAGVVAQEPQPGAGVATPGATLALTVNAHPVPLSTAGVHAIVRRPSLRQVPFAWTIQPGIRTQEGEVWASDLEGNRSFVASVTVRGGEILRGSWTTLTPGPVTFELLIGGVPYGGPLLVP